MPFAHYPDFEPDDDPPPDPAKPNGKARGVGSRRPPADELAHVWADNITLDLGRPGLVDGLLASTGMTVQYGESGSGKTFVALDLGCHVAAGLPWRGMDVEQGVVVYVAAESPESVQLSTAAQSWSGRRSEYPSLT